MEKALAQWLERQLGAAALKATPVAGGCIHQAWRLELAGGRLCFLKTNRAAALPLLQAEAEGLEALASVAPPTLALPRPLAASAVVGQQALLLLSWLELGGSDAAGWRQLGQNLAELHRSSLQRGPGCGCYGWWCDNFIGATPQPNGWHSSWGQFFASQRLGHQLALAQAAGQTLEGGQALQQQVPLWLAGHAPEPVLLHGDLWSGNAALLRGGGGAIYDPAVYRGDREVDLAMARLFGGFPEAFFSGYDAVWPLPPEAVRRAELYNLYHLLNHANLFGGGYWGQAQRCITGLLG